MVFSVVSFALNATIKADAGINQAGREIGSNGRAVAASAMPKETSVIIR